MSSVIEPQDSVDYMVLEVQGFSLDVSQHKFPGYRRKTILPTIGDFVLVESLA
jgi:hypothetical protein